MVSSPKCPRANLREKEPASLMGAKQGSSQQRAARRGGSRPQGEVDLRGYGPKGPEFV